MRDVIKCNLCFLFFIFFLQSVMGGGQQQQQANEKEPLLSSGGLNDNPADVEKSVNDQSDNSNAEPKYALAFSAEC